MASPRVVKILEIMKENFHNLGYSLPVKNVQGKSADAAFFPGTQGLVIDFDAATWATGKRRAVLLAIPAGFGESDAVKTQSHAAGNFIDGSVKFALVVEAAAGLSHTSTEAELAFARFQADILHVLRGQLSSPVDLYVCDKTEQPEIEGIDGSTASSAHLTKVGSLLPYGRTYVGGI